MGWHESSYRQSRWEVALTKRIYITIPNDGTITNYAVECLLKLIPDSRYNTKVAVPRERPYENNLHHCVNSFMESDCTHWLSFDADNPPRANPLDLVALDRDIIGLPTPVWGYTRIPGHRPLFWNAWDYVPEKDAYREHAEKVGLQEVDAIGTGCFLISRRVFEHPGMRQAPFARKCNLDGTVDKGNDLSFCERARARGFRIWAHYDYPCDHYRGGINLVDVEASIADMIAGPGVNDG